MSAPAADGWPAKIDRAAVHAWLRQYVEPSGAIEVVHVRPWSTVARVPTSKGRMLFKACERVQWHEPYVSQQLSLRWADRVAEVLAIDEERGWMLMADAGESVIARGITAPDVWLEVLPRYAELQRGEVAHVNEYLAHGMPDLRPSELPAGLTELSQRPELPLSQVELRQLRSFRTRFVEWCVELAARGVPPSVQHDDLHFANVYVQGGHTRVLDWGDAWIGHPFMSLVVTFRFVEDQAWHPRLRDAYLEPWGAGQHQTFDLAIRVGVFAHCIAWLRQRDALPEQARPAFDEVFRVVLRRALAQTA